MKGYAHHGFKEFIVALGYKGDVIKHYFMNYHNMSSDMTVDLASDKVTKRKSEAEKWIIHMIDTGQDTYTGGRVKRLEPWLKNETFMVTYGDGVANIDIRALLKFHRAQGCIGTVSAVRPPSRFGGIMLDGNRIAEFTEKPQIGEGWINGGFMVFEPEIFKYLQDDRSVLEIDGLEQLVADRQLAAYRHDKFWQCMDTVRDKRLLERLWQENKAPWKVW